MDQQPRPGGAAPGGARLGWKHIGMVLVQAVKDLAQDNVPQWAAAVAYYSLLSAFPLLLAAVAISAYFVPPGWVVDHLARLLSTYVPQGSARITQVVQNAMGARGTVGVLSILALLWSGTRVFSTVTQALNVAYDVDEPYGFWKRLLIQLVMLLTIGVIFILALATPPVLAALSGVVPGLPANGFLYAALTWLIPTALLLAGFTLTYRYVPRYGSAWSAALVGGVLATILFLIARPLFTYYLGQFAHYNLIYGSLAVVVVMVLWAWIVALILLTCGEIASHVQSMILKGESAGEVNREHAARSPNKKAPPPAQPAPSQPAPQRAAERVSLLDMLAVVGTMTGAALLWRFLRR